MIMKWFSIPSISLSAFIAGCSSLPKVEETPFWSLRSSSFSTVAGVTAIPVESSRKMTPDEYMAGGSADAAREQFKDMCSKKTGQKLSVAVTAVVPAAPDGLRSTRHRL